MLLFIIGLAVIVTMFVNTKVTEQEARYEKLRANGAVMAAGSVGGTHKPAVYSRTYIPAGSKIDPKQVELRETQDLELWDDAQSDVTEVVGNAPKHAIPANAQIRRCDLI